MAETNVDNFMGELNGGVFKEKLAHIISAVALGSVLHGDKSRKGKVIIELSFKKIGDNDQLVISHKLHQEVLTKRGKKTEVDSTETPMFVGRGGVTTISPPKEDQRGQFNLESVE